MASKFDSVWVPALLGNFLTSYEGTINNSWAKDILRKYDSKTEFVKILDLGTVGKVRQFSGSRQEQAAITYTQTLQNLPYEVTLPIDADDYRRDSLGAFTAKAAEMGAKFADHINSLTVNILTTNPTGFDGVALYSASHPVNATTQKNLLTNTDVPALACTVAATPTVLEMSNALLGVIGWFGSMTDEVGDPINGGAREFTVAFGSTKLWSTALAAVTSAQVTSGQTNPLLGLQNNGWKINITIDPRLGTSSASCWVFRTDSPMKPLVWSEELPFQMSYLGEESTEYVMNNRLIWAGKAVRAIAPGRYQHTVKATFS